MTMTETPEAPTKPKRKYRRRYKPIQKINIAPREPKVSAALAGEFPGLTDKTCSTACSEKGCIISGDICVHPHKGGLQSSHKMKRDVVDRYERVVKAMKQAKLDAE